MKINFKIKIIFSLIIFFLTFWGVFAKAQNIDIHFQKTFGSSWAFIDNPNTYDYSPTAMVDDSGREMVWDCGGGDVDNGLGGDSIFLSAFQNGLHVPGLDNLVVLRHSGLDSDSDGKHACAPTVVKQSYYVIDGGHEKYMMYYECAPKLYDRNTGAGPLDGFTQICHAVSQDGIHWQKWNEDLWNSQFVYGSENTPPTPVIKIDQKIVNNCQLTFSGGKFLAYFAGSWGCGGSGADNYGVGHPSAIVMDVNGQKQIWLYYYDSQGDASQAKVFLTKSWDGFHFETPVVTNLTQPVNVNYLNTPVGDYPGVFLGLIEGGAAENYYVYSFDGINWINSARTGDKIGLATNNLCMAPGISAFVGDKYGILYSPTVNIFSNEGHLGIADGIKSGDICYSAQEDASRGSTWGIYLIQGKFTWLQSDTTPPAAPQGLSVQ